MDVTIVPVVAAEIPAVKELLSYTWKDTYCHYLSPQTIEKVTSIWHDPQRLTNQAMDPNTYFAVAKTTDAKIVGLVTAAKTDDDTLMIYRCYVHPQCQRQGIGSALMDRAVAAFPEARMVRLEVEEKNTNAVNFYHKHGFIDKGSKEEDVEGEKMTVTIMEKPL